MSAGKTEDFLCIQDISVFLITLQGFYHKLLLRFPAAVGAHQLGACLLQELGNNGMEKAVKAPEKGFSPTTLLSDNAFGESAPSIFVSCNFWPM